MNPNNPYGQPPNGPPHAQGPYPQQQPSPYPQQPQGPWGPYPPQQQGQYGQMPYPHPTPAKVGLFGAIPCPYCGYPTRTGGSAWVGYAGGLVGALLYRAFASKHRCDYHGEIPFDAFPLDHQTTITVRKIFAFVGAGVLLVVVLMILVASQMIR